MKRPENWQKMAIKRKICSDAQMSLVKLEYTCRKPDGICREIDEKKEVIPKPTTGIQSTGRYAAPTGRKGGCYTTPYLRTRWGKSFLRRREYGKGNLGRRNQLREGNYLLRINGERVSNLIEPEQRDQRGGGK